MKDFDINREFKAFDNRYYIFSLVLFKNGWR